MCRAVAAAAWPASAQAQLRGHGGPVRALAISPDGKEAISGSFDTSAIRWSLTRNVAEQVMRFHDNAVNAVAWLKDGRIATAGADAHIAIWSPGKQQPDSMLDGHTGPIVGLAVSPDGKTLASASWDHTVRLWPLTGGTPRVLQGHAQKRQRRRLHAGRQAIDQRRLRRDLAHLAIVRRRRGGAQPADAAQLGGGCARRRDRHRRRRRQSLFPFAQGRDARAMSKPRRRRSSPSLSPRTASWSPPPAFAVRWR